MSENLEDLTPNQRRALNKGLAALETMAAMWGAEIRIHDVAQRLSAKPDAERAKAIAAFIEQAFIEGAYRHYLDRDPAACPELERASQPGSGEAEDAARYRWLRNRPVGKGVPLVADGIQFIFAVRDDRQSWVVHSMRGEEMDTAIDAAMADQAQKGGERG
jgi:hypothetical protein